MDVRDIVDDVNALLNLGVGEPYRLEHIKQTYIENKSLWLTDENYLNQLREKYLLKHNSATLTNFEESSEESGDSIHCWKCGKKSGLGANFCMVCGASMFDVGSENKTISKETLPESKIKQSINLKFPIIIAIPVIILIILGVAYSQGFFDDSFEKSSPEITETVVEDTPQIIDPDDPNSKCGVGTIFDSESNSCVLG